MRAFVVVGLLTLSLVSSRADAGTDPTAGETKGGAGGATAEAEKNAPAWQGDPCAYSPNTLTVHPGEQGRWIVTPDALPPSRTIMSFVKLDAKGTDPIGTHVEVEWDPLTNGRLALPVYLGEGKWQVAFWSRAITQSDNASLDTAWQFWPELDAKARDGCSVKLARNQFVVTRLVADVIGDKQRLARRTIRVTAKRAAPSAHPNKLDGMAVAPLAIPGVRSLALPSDEEVDELLGIVAEVAVERARARVEAFVEKRVLDRVCSEKTRLYLVQTCRLLENVRLLDAGAAGRPLVQAISADLLGVVLAIHSTAKPGHLPDTKRLASYLSTAGGADLVDEDFAHALLMEMYEASSKAPDWRKYAFTAVDDCLAAPSCNLSSVVRNLRTEGQFLSREETAALGALLEAMRVGGKSPTQRLRAVVRSYFALWRAENPADTELQTKIVVLEATAVAVLDGDVQGALAATSQLQAVNVTCPSDPTRTCVLDPKSYARAASVLGALASFLETYREAENEADAAARRQARKESLESLVDRFADRTERWNEIIPSVGVNVGLLAGYGWGSSGYAEGAFASPSLPLGLAVDGVWQTNEKHELGVGFHAQLYAIDVGQYLSFNATGELPLTRLDTSLAVGGQLGVLLGQPSNPFIIGLDLRGSPAVGSKEPELFAPAYGFVLRAGVYVGYYVPFLDLN